jgi:hypothetical protein
MIPTFLVNQVMTAMLPSIPERFHPMVTELINAVADDSIGAEKVLQIFTDGIAGLEPSDCEWMIRAYAALLPALQDNLNGTQTEWFYYDVSWIEDGVEGYHTCIKAPNALAAGMAVIFSRVNAKLVGITEKADDVDAENIDTSMQTLN